MKHHMKQIKTLTRKIMSQKKSLRILKFKLKTLKRHMKN